MDRPVYDRGTPVVPIAADAERILADFTRLSKVYGCDVRADGATATVRLA